MSLQVFDKNIDPMLYAFMTVSAHCIKYITVEDAQKLGIAYNEEDVNLGLIKGVWFKNDFGNQDVESSLQTDINMCWKYLGFKDDEFIKEKDFNKKYIEYANNTQDSKKVRS